MMLEIACRENDSEVRRSSWGCAQGQVRVRTRAKLGMRASVIVRVSRMVVIGGTVRRMVVIGGTVRRMADGSDWWNRT